MAEESDLEKTEPASERRLEKAREEGNVARSRELTTFVMLGTASAGLWFTARMLSKSMDGSLRRGLQFERASAFDPSHMLAQTGLMALQTLMAVGPLFGMMMVAAVAAPLMLGGWMFSSEAVAPKFSKLNPLAGIVRMFSAQSLAELVKALAKSALIGGVAWWVIVSDIEAVMALSLDFHFSKDEILEAYINEIFLGQDGPRAIHGFGLASQYYFNRPMGDLELHQLALLTALVRGASYYDPWRNPERALARRNLVLQTLHTAGHIDDTALEQASLEPLDVGKRYAAARRRYPAYLDLVRRRPLE